MTAPVTPAASVETSQPTKGVAFGPLGNDLGAIRQGREAVLEERRVRHARTDGVDPDSFPGEIERGGADEVDHATLRRAVGGQADLAEVAVDARDAHDHPATGPAHLWNGVPDHEERAA